MNNKDLLISPRFREGDTEKKRKLFKKIKAEKQEEIKSQELEEEKCRLQTSFLDKILFFCENYGGKCAMKIGMKKQHKPPFSFPLSWEGGAGACRQNSCSMSRKSKGIKKIDKH